MDYQDKPKDEATEPTTNDQTAQESTETESTEPDPDVIVDEKPPQNGSAEHEKKAHEFEMDKLKKNAAEFSSALLQQSRVFAEKASVFAKQGAEVFKKKAGEAAEAVSDAAKVSKLRFEISSIKRRLEDAYLNLGRLTYELVRTGDVEHFATHERIATLVNKINEYENEIAHIEARIKELQQNENATVVEKPASEVKPEEGEAPPSDKD